MNALKVVKIGGRVIDDEAKLDAFLKDFSKLKGSKILVHGGGSTATKIGEKLGIQPNMIDGRRVTDDETLDLITMVYGGLVNKKIVAKLQGLGVNAAGFSGADLDIIPAKKRNSMHLDYGWVGDIEKVNTEWLMKFLREDIVPVLAPLTHDGRGNLLNTNADAIASFTASALAEFMDVELMFCFEQPGVMNKEKQITQMNLLLFRHLKDTGIITDGMIPKLDLGFKALKKGVQKISIRNFDAVNRKKTGTELIQ
ncbi:MAG: acetylglutamate kinase [Balneolaceae bacterium]